MRIRYDHRVHAGNAGDLWKHFLLMEVADHLFRRDKSWTYVESHTGSPEYRLGPGGEWEGGIGRFSSRLCDLRSFPYFEILDEFNPKGVRRYFGSASLVLELARMRNVPIGAELWDLDLRVRDEWDLCDDERVHFHLGDGFSGAESLIESANPALLLVDSPYIDEGDVKKAEDLICKAASSGRVVLCWHMLGMGNAPHPSCDHEVFALEFQRLGLDCGKWKGALMILGGNDENLAIRLDKRVDEFLQIIDKYGVWPCFSDGV